LESFRHHLPMNFPSLSRLAFVLCCAAPLSAHQPAAVSVEPAAAALPFAVEQRGPVRTPKALAARAGLKLSGQGFWTFTPVAGAVPVPAEAEPHLKGAHGTVLFEADTDTVYWGLEKVGWIEFRNRLTTSRVVKGDPAMTSGNLHGADLWPRKGQRPLVAAADNVEGEVYLTDTSFQTAQKLKLPPFPPYADGKGYAPTDVAFADRNTLFVTDGYGRAHFFPVTVEPFQFRDEFHGGKAISQTPHGITLNPADHTLAVSARPEAQVKHWSQQEKRFLEVQGLPAGSAVCDVDIWGDYLLAACLTGPNRTPGPLYVINHRTKRIVSTIKPKEELGYEFAQHMHDACWYFTGNGRRREVYIVFTAWNPGGIGALKLVNAGE
jgi:hypothetical protein